MRRLAAAAVAGVLLVAVAACSSDSSSSKETPVAESTPNLPATQPASTAVAASTASTVPATTSTSTSSAPSSTSPATDTSTAPATTTSTTTPAAGATIAELLALGRPVVLAHTGGEDEFPGSTMFGYGESIKAGVDMVDLNVMLTGDGVLVIQHDDSVDRLTNSTGKVADMTYAELSALDNAYWFTADGVQRDHPDDDYLYRGIRTGERPPPAGYTADDFAVPTFRELVERYPTMPLNIEIEGSGEPAAAAARVLATELRELGRLDASVVAGFDDATVATFHQLEPTVEMSPGFGASAAFILSGTPLPDGMRILQLPPRSSGVEVLTPEHVTAAHDAGYLIWVWPNDRSLENRAAYDQFLRDGMDGLNINFPAQGVAAAHEFVPTTT